MKLPTVRPFEMGLMAFFIIAFLGGIACFSKCDIGDDPEDNPFDKGVVIWGTLDARVMGEFLDAQKKANPNTEKITYTRIDPRTFEAEFIDTLAEGKSPDLIILPHDRLVSLRTKLYAIPFKTYPERTFKDQFIDGAEIFVRNDGIYGLPFAVDPLIMYWNKDIFSTAGIAQPPKTWEEIVSGTVKALVRKDSQLTLSQSAVALGEYDNVTNAKAILLMLMLQTGSRIVDETEKGYRVMFDIASGGELSAGDAALPFYTQFAIRTNELYSWNRSKQNDRTEFLNGTLGLYFGRGSEYAKLERDNPNFSFDIAQVPQGSGVTTKRNYGDFYAFAIPRASKNIGGAYAAAVLFTSTKNGEELANGYNFAPTTRSAYSTPQSDLFKSITYKSALISYGWLDPDPEESNEVFREMVNEIVAGGVRVGEVVSDGVKKIENLF